MNGYSVVSILAGVTAVMTAALGMTSVLRRHRAATRHALLTAAFAVALVLPAVSAVATYTTIRVPVPMPAVVSNAVASLDELAAPLPPVEPGAQADRVPAGQPMTGVPLTAIIGAIWLLGFVACLVPVAVGLTEVRSLGRRGLPWRHGRALADRFAATLGIRRLVGIVLHESVSGPMTFGTLRPTIVMPADAETWPDDELARAVVHELEHVRRADWLTQCVARTLCAAYWFNPLVWIARRQLVLEAERASDDAVLQYADASEYADQLVDLAKRLSAGHQPFLAMANRHDLAARVRALLDGHQPRGRARTWLVAGVSCAAAALVMVLSPMRVVARAVGTPVRVTQDAPSSNTAPQALRKFDVASVRACDQASSGRGRGGAAGPGFSPGRLYLPCIPVRMLIEFAYVMYGGADGSSTNAFDNWPTLGQSNEDGAKRIRGGPSWMYDNPYTIEAEADGITKAEDRGLVLGPMLRALLEDRFKLKMHQGTEQASMYALTVAKGGLLIKPMKDGDCTTDYSKGHISLSAAAEGHVVPTCFIDPSGPDGPNWRHEHIGDSLDRVAAQLSADLGIKVLDQTGVAGKFIFTWVYGPDDRTPGARRRPDPADASNQPAPTAPDIFTALKQQVGLQLDPTKGSRPYLVVDHVERPTIGEASPVPSDALGGR